MDSSWILSVLAGKQKQKVVKHLSSFQPGDWCNLDLEVPADRQWKADNHECTLKTEIKRTKSQSTEIWDESGITPFYFLPGVYLNVLEPSGMFMIGINTGGTPQSIREKNTEKVTYWMDGPWLGVSCLCLADDWPGYGKISPLHMLKWTGIWEPSKFELVTVTERYIGMYRHLTNGFERAWYQGLNW